MVQEALAVEAIVGIPAVERGPKIPNLSLVSVMKLLGFVILLLWMFPDVDMLLSKLLERDKTDIRYWLLGPPLASIVPCTSNERHAHANLTTSSP